MRKMEKMLVVALVSAFLLLVGGTAGAALIEGDLAAPGDGLVTLDTATGLEWLDLTATLGMSYNQAEASSYVTSDGFRHATMAEAQTLFLDAGFLTVNNVNNPANDPAAALLLDLVGCTQFCGTVNATGRGFADYTTPGWTTRPNYHNSGLGAGAAVVSLLSSNLDLVDTTSGNFLVRVASVPEPSTGLLVAIGLVVAAGRRSRRRAA